MRFTVNGKEVVVGKEVGPQTRLARFKDDNDDDDDDDGEKRTLRGFF